MGSNPIGAILNSETLKLIYCFLKENDIEAYYHRIDDNFSCIDIYDKIDGSAKIYISCRIVVKGTTCISYRANINSLERTLESKISYDLNDPGSLEKILKDISLVICGTQTAN